MNFYKYYEDGGWQYTIEMLIIAFSLDEAVVKVWEYLESHPDYNTDYTTKQEIRENTKRMPLDSGVIADLSRFAEI